MEAKQKLFKVMERIDEIKSQLGKLTDKDKLELENLEVKQMQYWSDWKDQ